MQCKISQHPNPWTSQFRQVFARVTVRYRTFDRAQIRRTTHVARRSGLSSVNPHQRCASVLVGANIERTVMTTARTPRCVKSSPTAAWNLGVCRAGNSWRRRNEWWSTVVGWRIAAVSLIVIVLQLPPSEAPAELYTSVASGSWNPKSCFRSASRSGFTLRASSRKTVSVMKMPSLIKVDIGNCRSGSVSQARQTP